MATHQRENEQAADECRYLAGILRTGGDCNVPRDAMGSYFRVQEAGARRKRFHCLAATLREIADDIEAGTVDAEASRIKLLVHAAALS